MPPTRRDFFRDATAGLGGIALAWMLHREASAAAPGREGGELGPKPTHFPPRVKRVVQVFAMGGVSHLDTFDYKPELARREGQELAGKGKIDPSSASPAA
jgi:hypothetical protein